MSTQARTLVAGNSDLWGDSEALFEDHDVRHDREFVWPKAALSSPAKDLSREVYCLQGIPVDAVVRRIEIVKAGSYSRLRCADNISQRSQTHREKNWNFFRSLKTSVDNFKRKLRTVSCA